MGQQKLCCVVFMQDKLMTTSGSKFLRNLVCTPRETGLHIPSELVTFRKLVEVSCRMLHEQSFLVLINDSLFEFMISLLSSYINKSIGQPLMCLFNLASILCFSNCIDRSLPTYSLTHQIYTRKKIFLFLLKDYLKLADQPLLPAALLS